MKKIALILVCSAFLFSCGTATTEETPAADSTATAVVVDTTVAVETAAPAADSTATAVVVDTTVAVNFKNKKI
jgi:hypothetical protein